MSHRFRSLAFILACLTLGITLAPRPAAALRRVALVIGNSDYASSPLRNPSNDAKDMAEVLKRLGMEVALKQNADMAGMLKAVNDFGANIKRADVALFYYAGHGMQIKGRNFLVPVDFKAQSESDVEYEAVDVGRILGKMEEAGAPMNIIILDACRNNPFARSFRSMRQGLAQMDAPMGSIIAYATAPGSVAADGDDRNGVYTKNLLAAIQAPDTPIEEVFKRVRVKVMEETGKQQVPWESSSLTGNFSFNQTGAAPVSAPSAAPAAVSSMGAGSAPRDAGAQEAAAEPVKTAALAPAIMPLLSQPAAEEARSRPAPAGARASLKLLVMLDENCQTCGGQRLKVAETELVSLLRAKGFELVDREQIEKVVSQDQARQALAGDAKAAAAIALAARAQYVVLGAAEVQGGGEAYAGTGVQSVSAVLQTRVAQAQSGRIIGSRVDQSAGVGVTPLAGATQGLKKAAKLAADAIAGELAGLAGAASVAPEIVRIQVRGVRSLAQHGEVLALCQGLSGGAEVSSDGWNKAGGLAALGVPYAGSSQTLAGLLEGKALKAGGRIQVEDVGPGRIDAVVVGGSK